MFCNSFGGICRANRVKKIRIRKNTIKNIAPQAGMYRRRAAAIVFALRKGYSADIT